MTDARNPRAIQCCNGCGQWFHVDELDAAPSPGPHWSPAAFEDAATAGQDFEWFGCPKCFGPFWMPGYLDGWPSGPRFVLYRAYQWLWAHSRPIKYVALFAVLVVLAVLGGNGIAALVPALEGWVMRSGLGFVAGWTTVTLYQRRRK